MRPWVLALVTVGLASAIIMTTQTGLPDGRALLLALLEYLSENATLSGAVMLWGAQVAGYLVMVPTSILSVAAGCAYGLSVGLVVGQLGHVFGCLPPFLASRRLIRRHVARFAANRPLAHGIMAAVDEQPFTICCLLRMSPAPLPLSYILGLTSIPVQTYLVASMLGAFPQLFFSVYLGTLMSTVTEVLALGGAAAAAVSVVISRAAQRKISEASAAALAEPNQGGKPKGRAAKSPAKTRPAAAAEAPRGGGKHGGKHGGKSASPAKSPNVQTRASRAKSPRKSPGAAV